MAKAKQPAKRPAKAKAKAKRPKATPKAKAKRPKATPKTKPKAKPKARPKKPVADASTVVAILDADDPIAALRQFLAGIDGAASKQQGQIALGAAQLIFLPVTRDHRGGPEVQSLLDLVLDRWDDFPDRSGFHAQEFLRNAFAAVGEDRERLARLVACVPVDASPELRFNVACALALAGERVTMLRAVEAALAVGVSATQIQRDPDFTESLDDPALQRLLADAGAPVIPVDIRPYTSRVRAAVDSLVKTLRTFGETPQLQPPATLDTVLAVERARKIQLPNDYRALLTIANGMSLWDHAFFGVDDFSSDTPLARDAREYLAMSSRYGTTGIDDCVPLANWGQPNDWLLYDPHGRVRGGHPGYVLMLNADERPFDDLTDALDHLERMTREVLGTN